MARGKKVKKVRHSICTNLDDDTSEVFRHQGGKVHLQRAISAALFSQFLTRPPPPPDLGERRRKGETGVDEIKMNVCNSSQRQHPVLWAMAGLCAGVQLEEVTLLHCSLAPVVTPKWPRGQEVREPVCTCTYVGGLFLKEVTLSNGPKANLRGDMTQGGSCGAGLPWIIMEKSLLMVRKQAFLHYLPNAEGEDYDNTKR